MRRRRERRGGEGEYPRQNGVQLINGLLCRQPLLDALERGAVLGRQLGTVHNNVIDIVRAAIGLWVGGGVGGEERESLTFEVGTDTDRGQDSAVLDLNHGLCVHVLADPGLGPVGDLGCRHELIEKQAVAPHILLVRRPAQVAFNVGHFRRRPAHHALSRRIVVVPGWCIVGGLLLGRGEGVNSRSAHP